MNPVSLEILKYPRTPHLEGSRLQGDDTAEGQAALADVAGLYCVLEEKIDCANSGISCSPGAELLLQSRGHYLTGGGRERQFGPLKSWAAAHEGRLLELLDDRFVMYGEFCHAKHSIFYDALPHLFCEFDIYDRVAGHFLSTKRRHALLKGTPVVSVPVLYAGEMPGQQALLQKLVRRSLAKSDGWRNRFEEVVSRDGLDVGLAWRQTDQTDLGEGLYCKVEDDEKVLARFKYVRKSFVQTILDSASHHSDRPLVPNQLAAGVDLYAPEPQVTWESLGLRTVTSLDELKEWEHPADAGPKERRAAADAELNRRFIKAMDSRWRK